MRTRQRIDARTGNWISRGKFEASALDWTPVQSDTEGVEALSSFCLSVQETPVTSTGFFVSGSCFALSHSCPPITRYVRSYSLNYSYSSSSSCAIAVATDFAVAKKPLLFRNFLSFTGRCPSSCAFLTEPGDEYLKTCASSLTDSISPYSEINRCSRSDIAEVASIRGNKWPIQYPIIHSLQIICIRIWYRILVYDRNL